MKHRTEDGRIVMSHRVGDPVAPSPWPRGLYRAKICVEVEVQHHPMFGPIEDAVEMSMAQLQWKLDKYFKSGNVKVLRSRLSLRKWNWRRKQFYRARRVTKEPRA